MNVQHYTGVHACAVAGCSYRQLDWWARAGTVEPVVAARGPGSQRLYDLDGIRSLRLATLLSAHGSVNQARGHGLAGVVIARAVTAANTYAWAGYMFIADEGVGVSDSAMDALDLGGGILVTLVDLGMVAAYVDIRVELVARRPVGA